MSRCDLAKKYYAENKEKIKARAKAYYWNNKQKIAEHSQNPERRLAKAKSDKKYWANAPEWVKENRKKRIAEWAQNNKGRRSANEQKRRDRIKNATVPWANLEAICNFYRNCPDGFTVDHIIPLQGKEITGLHILENLQYLPMTENCKKSNKFY